MQLALWHASWFLSYLSFSCSMINTETILVLLKLFASGSLFFLVPWNLLGSPHSHGAREGGKKQGLKVHCVSESG